MALCGASLVKDEFNVAQVVARPVFPALAFVATRLMFVSVLQETEAEDWQEIPASADLPKLFKFMIYLYVTDGRKAFWRITLPVLPVMLLRIRPITGHEMGQISPKDIFFTLQLLTTQKSLLKSRLLLAWLNW